jgi:hypothetical protein
MAHDLSDAFGEYDSAALAGLTPAEREQQLRARWSLYHHIDAIWQAAKGRGLDPAIRPEWSVVAGLRDLTMALATQAEEAQHDAGDEAAS